MRNTVCLVAGVCSFACICARSINKGNDRQVVTGKLTGDQCCLIMVLRTPNTVGMLTVLANKTNATNMAVKVYFCIRDRKSTRLNSSHVRISYAASCLKKKKSV